MTLRIVVLHLFALVCLGIVFSRQPGGQATLYANESVDVAAIVDSIGQKAVADEQAVGLSIGVAKADTVLCAKGFGLTSVELNVPASAKTVYRIGSITKQFTAVAILRLVEDGTVKLDDPLTKFLPDYPIQGRDVTIKHLLQHTSGIQDFTRLPLYRQELPNEVSQEDVLARFQDLPLDFEPGEKHQYCNSGYYLLGVVIERASGKSFQKFAEEHLFDAAGLEATYCDTHARVIPRRATGYSRWGGVLRNARYLNLKQAVGAGNLASTVGDLLLWQRTLVEHGLLTDESRRLMTTKGELADGKTFDYGLGVFVRKFGEHDVVRHGGGIQGFRADLAYFPKSGYTIAVLANCDSVNASRISGQIARRLLVEAGTDDSP